MIYHTPAKNQKYIDNSHAFITSYICTEMYHPVLRFKNPILPLIWYSFSFFFGNFAPPKIIIVNG